jgi:antitoxin (DNA-binding transcriptional repressor) of toxin-antitoxin stability system
MKAVTFTGLRKNAFNVLNRVENGETVQVLRHGMAIARIVPVDAR